MRPPHPAYAALVLSKTCKVKLCPPDGREEEVEFQGEDGQKGVFLPIPPLRGIHTVIK
jgi:hypothetical protein